jgi:sec-independent protein translocase protein TatA
MGLDNPTHLAILFIILLLVFGAKRLPELGRSLGAGLRGFKESINPDSATATPQARELTPAPMVVADQPAEPIRPVA